MILFLYEEGVRGGLTSSTFDIDTDLSWTHSARTDRRGEKQNKPPPYYKDNRAYTLKTVFRATSAEVVNTTACSVLWESVIHNYTLCRKRKRGSSGKKDEHVEISTLNLFSLSD